MISTAKMSYIIYILFVFSLAAQYTFGGLFDVFLNHGSTKVTLGEYPSVVAVQYEDGPICTGTIIDESFVLTAGHCALPDAVRSPDSFKVITGTTDYNRGGQIYTVNETILHPEYKDPTTISANNIVLLKLSEPIVFNRYQNKARIAAEDPLDQTPAIFVSWAYTGLIHHDLRKLNVQFLRRNGCLTKVSGDQQMIQDGLFSEQVCTVVPNKKDNCFGEHGSPLFVNNELVAIMTNSVEGTCDSKDFTLLTSVPYFRDSFIYPSIKAHK